MRILVTGGSGFVGSHLCQRLLNDGNFVIAVDNCFSSDKNNINNVLDNKNFEFIRHDIIHPLRIEVDQIYNLACPASPIHYQKDPIQTIQSNVIGAMNILELAKRLNAKVLQASTSEIYGDPDQHPQQESYWGNVNPIGIRSCYDEGKRCAETLFTDYHRKYNLDIAIARIFNTYGPKMHVNDGRVVSNFIVQALQTKNITIYGEGNQTRSFQYVDDLVDGLVLLMQADESSPINLGNPVEFTILELAETVLRLTKSKSKIEHKNLPSDDPKQRKPCIQKAKTILNWEPKIQLEEGLSKTINYFKNKLEIDNA